MYMDSSLIIMPKTLHEFLIATAIAQDYSIQLAVGAERQEREAYYQIAFRMEEKFKYIEPILRVVKNNLPVFDYSGWDQVQRGEFDCIMNFDFNKGRAVASKVGRHITVGFNALFGTGALGWPILKALQLHPDESLMVDVLILGSENKEYAKFYEFISNNYPELTIVGDPRDITSYTVQEIIEYINHFKIVVGPHSVLTYLAVCLGKVCIEVFKTSEEAVLYGSSGKSNYRAVIGQNITAEFVWTVWEEVWPELLQNMNNQGVLNKVG